MSKHTPGPWKIVLTKQGPAVTDENNRDIINRDALEAYPNARLIALAPEMLEVLSEIDDYFRYTDAPLGQKARAILSKLEDCPKCKNERLAYSDRPKSA